MRFEPAPEYQVFPTRERPLKPYEAAVRAARETAAADRASVDPDVVVADILTVAGGARGGAARAAVGDARPPRAADSRARLPAVLDRRAAAADAGRARRCGARSTRSCGAATERGRARAERDAARGSGCRRSTTCTAGSRASWRSSRPSRSSSTRGTCVVAVGARDRARCCGSGRRTTSSCRRATSRSCWSRRAPRRTASSGCCARRSRGWPTSRCGCSRRPTSAATRSATSPCPANARVVDWLSYARTMPHCAAVVCHAGHGTVVRALACGVPVVGVPRRGRHGGERGARALGRAPASRCRAGS